MKLWFAKFRLSNALDSGRPLPRELRRQLETRDELRTFAGRVYEMDSALRERPATQAPSDLHDSVMQAVRGVERSGRSAPRSINWVGWLPAPALALCAICAWLWLSHRQAETRSLPSLSSAFESGEQMAKTFPAELVDPLQEELRRVNLDLDDTARFLVASVPF